jgi:hypothetical protein
MIFMVCSVRGCWFLVCLISWSICHVQARQDVVVSLTHQWVDIDKQLDPAAGRAYRAVVRAVEHIGYVLLLKVF